MRKKAFNIEFELYKLLSNQLREIDIDSLSECLKISKKTCLRYSRKPKEIDEIVEVPPNDEDDEMEDYYDDYFIHTNGYKEFNQHKHFVPSISKEDLKAFKSEVFENTEITDNVKSMLLKLLAHNLWSMYKYGDSIEKILYCIENKKYLEVNMQFGQSVISSLSLSPIYIDLDNSYLYAVSYGENLYRFNIHSLEGLKVSDNRLKFDDSFDRYFDDIVGLSFGNKDKDIIDSFGSPYIERDSVFSLRLLLDNYAKSELLRDNINLKKHIKRYKYNEFCFVLETTVYNLSPVFDFIVRYNSHTLLVGDKNAKKKLITHLGEVVKNLNGLQNRLVNRKT